MTPPTFVRRSIFAVVLFPLGIRPVRSVPADPIFAAIDYAKATDAELTVLLADLGEDVEEDERRANHASDIATRAFDALSEIRPTTDAGFRALVEFYAEHIELNEPYCTGGQYLRHVLAAIPTGGA